MKASSAVDHCWGKRHSRRYHMNMISSGVRLVSHYEFLSGSTVFFHVYDDGLYVLSSLAHIRVVLLDANSATSRAHLASAPSTASGDITRALGVSSTPISNGSKHQETPHPLQAFPFKCLSALTHHCNVGSSKTRIMISKFEVKL